MDGRGKKGAVPQRASAKEIPLENYQRKRRRRLEPGTAEQVPRERGAARKNDEGNGVKA